MTSPIWLDMMPIDDVAAELRSVFVADTYASVSFDVTLKSERTLGFGGNCCGDGAIRRGASGPLGISPFDKVQLLPLHLPLPVRVGARSVEMEAALSVLVVQDDVEDILLRLCAPDASGRVTTGGYTRLWHWGAPVEMGASYHADAALIARDIALSWLHLHDGDTVEHLAGMSTDALHARIDAAPSGECAAVALGVDRVREHVMLERTAGHVRHVPHGRVAMPGDIALSRETVVRALSAPPGALLEALEASAVPDDEWRAVESSALETIEATKAGAPTYEVDVTTRKHVQFIERHAPYHVRRLPNGGVLLATHPYRTLWPLYADALFLLGITS